MYSVSYAGYLNNMDAFIGVYKDDIDLHAAFPTNDTQYDTCRYFSINYLTPLPSEEPDMIKIAGLSGDEIFVDAKLASSAGKYDVQV